MTNARVVCVVGPTAVGKSRVAELVAQRLQSEVVSVDSMQVYRGMDVGTAKVPTSKRLCPLRMVDVADFSEPYSVAQFQRDARAHVGRLVGEGRIPILCGGTGLYLDAVIDDMRFPTGQTNGADRMRYESLAASQGPLALHALLAERDPKSAAQIHPNNVRRVVRALEMLDGGVSYAEHHRGLRLHTPYYQASLWALTLPREELYDRISLRVDAMFEQGLVDEVRRLEAQGLRSSSTASQAIGYKEVLQALDGTMTLDEARELVKRNTRRYAKRQLSWLRRDGRARWIDLSTCGQNDAASIICEAALGRSDVTSEA